MTGGCSGSTQMAAYLEDDNKNFIVPMIVEAMFPYIWSWKIIAPVLKSIGLTKYLEVSPPVFGEEFKKRHNISLLRTETWDIMIGIEPMNLLSFCLGASFCK